MIVDIDRFNSTSRGSGRDILCRCDTCGNETYAKKFKISRRKNGYRDCHRCAVTKVGRAKKGYVHTAESRTKISASRAGRPSRRLSPGARQISKRGYIETACADCGAKSLRRRDQLKYWAGKCRSCASKELARRPEILDGMRRNGVAVMKRVGKLPHYEHNYRRGAANNKWRGGITPEVMKIRNSVRMKEWRNSVFKRDDFTCGMCGTRGGNLHADHIQPFSLFPELRFDLDNGRTLCVPCHRQYGACVSNGKVTREAVLQGGLR